MKRVIMLLVILCMLTGLSACTLSSIENQIYKDSDSQEQTGSIPEHDAEENGLIYYKLSALPGSVGIGEDYDTYSPEYGYSEEMLRSQGISKEKLDLYLQLSGKDLIVVPKGESLGSPNFEISIRIKDKKDYGIDNLKNLNEATFKEFADLLVQGFALDGNPMDYSVYENDNAKYIVFDWTVGSLERRYATIINGKMVYFIVSAAGNPISADQEATAQLIMDTLQY